MFGKRLIETAKMNSVVLGFFALPLQNHLRLNQESTTSLGVAVSNLTVLEEPVSSLEYLAKVRFISPIHGCLRQEVCLFFLPVSFHWREQKRFCQE